MSGYAEWNSATAYATNDIVVYNGVVYIALQNSLNQVPPSSAAYWAASGGTTAGVSSLNALAGAVSVASLTPSTLTVGQSGNTIQLSVTGGSGGGVSSLNTLTGGLQIVSITPSIGVIAAGSDIQLSFIPDPPAGTVFQDQIIYGPGAGVVNSATTYTPTVSGVYLINYNTSIVSQTGLPITMNSALGDRIVAFFSRAPPGTDTVSFQYTGPISNPPAIVGQSVLVGNETATLQQLTAGITYRLSINSEDPSGTSAWDGAQTSTFLNIVGPV